jgi:ribonuclease P protein component
MNDHKEENNNQKIRFTFQKNERLCSKKVIEKLFAEGKSLFVFPLKAVYLETSLKTEFPAQVAFAVSKKSFKRAVMRNLLKRRMREAYRLNKNQFYDEISGKQIALFLIYTSKTEETYAAIESATKKVLKRVLKELKSEPAQK